MTGAALGSDSLSSSVSITHTDAALPFILMRARALTILCGGGSGASSWGPSRLRWIAAKPTAAASSRCRFSRRCPEFENRGPKG
jgi:hypothetical protein